MLITVLPEFQQAQIQFAAHIRNPEEVALLDGVEARRMKIYNDLFFNNIESFAANAFPVFKSLLVNDDWLSLVREFLVKHRCRSPYFPEISEEFLQFLQSYTGSLTLPAYAIELAHYEWVELALDIADEEPQSEKIDPNGNLMTQKVVVSPVAWPLCYNYPVHLIGPNYKPEQQPNEASYLLVYRTRDFTVQFMEINAVTARLLDLLSAEALSGSAVIAMIAQEMQLPDPSSIEPFAINLLNKLQADGVILGTLVP